MTEKKSKNENKRNLVFIVIIAVVAFAAFANTLNGEFVYDDKRQISRNPLIKDSTLYSKALTSDVWAFKGDGTIAASNYWRPTFTAFSIISYRLFGSDTFGWHLLNILLHVGVCLLVFLLLRRWGLSDFSAFAITLVFAVHPIHTESVAWIAGSPDLLFSLFLLASLWFAQNYYDKQNRFDIILALVFYALALGAKEVALLCLPIYWLIYSNKADETKDRKEKSFNFMQIAPFILIGVVYFFARLGVIGQLSMPAEDAATFGNAILTAPSIFVFYLKQILFPITLGPNYSLRAIESFSVMSFLIPFITSIVAIFLLGLLAKRSFIQKLGLAFFILPILPAFNITAFTPEQIVHDRYLYLPLLGFLMIIFPYLKELFEKINKDNAVKITLGFAIVISILLFVKTFTYNKVWLDDLSLWTHSVTVDSNSAFNYSQLGSALSEKGKIEESIKAYNKSLDIKTTSLAYMGRARGFLAKKKYEDAIWDLKTVAEMPADKLNAYTLYQTYESLAVAHSQNKQLEKAEDVLLEARKRLPIYYAALTGKLAVVLYQKNQKQKALEELEKTQNQARVELLPESKTVLFRLGALYFEAKQNQKAGAALQEYLRLTNTMQDKLTQANRKQALAILKKL